MTETETLVITRSDSKGDSPMLLRKGVPGERKPLKEKLIAYYEILFKVKTTQQQIWYDLSDCLG